MENPYSMIHASPPELRRGCHIGSHVSLTRQRSKRGKHQWITRCHVCSTCIEGTTWTQVDLISPCTHRTTKRDHKAATQRRERANGPTMGSVEPRFGRTDLRSPNALLPRVGSWLAPKGSGMCKWRCKARKQGAHDPYKYRGGVSFLRHTTWVFTSLSFSFQG
jgi:hypothetical protein